MNLLLLVWLVAGITILIVGVVWSVRYTRRHGTALDRAEKQQERNQRILEQEEANIARHAAMLERWEKQAERVDRLIEQWERRGRF